MNYRCWKCGESLNTAGRCPPCDQTQEQLPQRTNQEPAPQVGQREMVLDGRKTVDAVRLIVELGK